MPEVSNSFQAGKMNKDADERLVGPGEYREALNIEVTTSEGSNVGTAQTVLGNVRVTGCDTNGRAGGGGGSEGGAGCDDDPVVDSCDAGMDVAFVVDYTSSMGLGIDSVKSGIASIVSSIVGLVGDSDYRLSLSLADEYTSTNPPYLNLSDYTSLPASQRSVTTGIVSPGYVGGTRDYYSTNLEQFSTNNTTSFTNKLNLLHTTDFPLGNANNHNFPECTDRTIDSVGLSAFSGAWRSGVAKYIIIMTDALPAGNDDHFDATDVATLSALASSLVSQGIKVIVIGYGTNQEFPAASGIYPWRVFAGDTNGAWDLGGEYPNYDYSTAAINALTTLCGDAGGETSFGRSPGKSGRKAGDCSCLDNSEKHYTVGSIVDEKVDRIIRLVASPAQENNGVGIDRIIEYSTSASSASKETPVFVDVYKTRTLTTGSGTIGLDNTIIPIVDDFGVRRGMRASVTDSSGNAKAGYTLADRLFVQSVSAAGVTLIYENGNPYTFTNTIVSGDILYFEAERVLDFDDPGSGFGGIAEKVSITGINIINDLLFWTDNYSEPKKIHIPRSKEGTVSFCTHTDLVVKNIALPSKTENKGFIKKEHVTVIRKGPTMPPRLEIWNTPRVDNTLGSGTELPDVTACQANILMATYSNGANRMWSTTNSPFFFSESVASPVTTYQLGDVLRFEHVYESASTGEFLTAIATGNVISNVSGGATAGMSPGAYEVQLTSITPNQPLEPTSPTIANYFVYDVTLQQKSAMWEFKFPRFAYRYKYSDGEYSPFGPFSEVAFVPGKFDYLPKKGYNLGMVNRLRYLEVSDWVPKNIPKDVIQVDILYKETSSPNVYTVESFKQNDPPAMGDPLNNWNQQGSVGSAMASHGHYGSFKVTSDLIHKTIPANQLLRPWDNVPRVAMAQEMIGNRIVYANYLQNYNLTTDSNLDVNKPGFTVSTSSAAAIIGNEGIPGKSLKSMRNYQVGIVYRDEFGRETPVLTSTSGTLKLPKSFATLMNRFDVTITTPPPSWAKTFKFFIKETSNEYYNLAMDRYYTAKDGNIWLSFPSSERNKVSEDTFIILKKQHDNHIFVEDEARYKIIAIENNAPEFIRTENRSWGSLSPYPSFVDSGSPYPGRQNIDIAWDTWKRSAFSNMDSSSNDGIEVRVRTPLNSFSSNWYEITNMGAVDLGPSEIMRLTSKDIFGEDMLFTSLDGGVSMINNLVLDVREKKVINRAQFDGRFFVKIYSDDVLVKNLNTQPLRDEADLVPVLSKRISYMNYCAPGEENGNMWDGWNGYGNAFSSSSATADIPTDSGVTDNTVGNATEWNQGNAVGNNSDVSANWGSAGARAQPWALNSSGAINTSYSMGTNFAAGYSVPNLPATAFGGVPIPGTPGSSIGDGFDANVLRYMSGSGIGNGARSQNASGTGGPAEFYKDPYFPSNTRYAPYAGANGYVAHQPLVVPRGSRWHCAKGQNSPGPWVGVWTDDQTNELHRNDPGWLPGLKDNGPWGGDGSSHPRGTSFGATTWGSNFGGYSISSTLNPVGGMLRKYWNSSSTHMDGTAIGAEPTGNANPAYPYSTTAIGVTRANAFNLTITTGSGVGALTGATTENAFFNATVQLSNYDWSAGTKWPRKVTSGGIGGTNKWWDSALTATTHTFTGWVEPFWGLGTFATYTAKGNRSYNSGKSVIKDLNSNPSYSSRYGDKIVGFSSYWGTYYPRKQWVDSTNPQATYLYPYPYVGINSSCVDNPPNKRLVSILASPAHNVLFAAGNYGYANWETMWNTVDYWPGPVAYDTATSPATDALPYGVAAQSDCLDGGDYSDEKYPPTGRNWVIGADLIPTQTNVVSSILATYSFDGSFLKAPDEEVPTMQIEEQFPLLSPRKSNAHPTIDWWGHWFGATDEFWSLRKSTEDPDYFQGYEKPPIEDPGKCWIIDKVGAAQDKCGGGMFKNSTTQAQMLDISYLGIGNGIRGNTIWNLSETPTELGFADAISTPGTRFRFKEDHNKTVYTITNSFLNTEGEPGYLDPDTGAVVYAADADKENPKILNYTSDPDNKDYDNRTNRRIRWRLQLDKKIGDSANNVWPFYNPISAAIDPGLIDQRGSSATNPNFNPFGRTTGAIGSAYARVDTEVEFGVTASTGNVNNILTLNDYYPYISKGLTMLKAGSGGASIKTVPATSLNNSNPLGTFATLKETFGVKVISRSFIDSAGEPEYLTEQDEENNIVNAAWNGTSVKTIIELSQAIKYNTGTGTGASNSRPVFGVGQHELQIYEYPSLGSPGYGGAVVEPVTGPNTNRQYFDSSWECWTSNCADRRTSFYHAGGTAADWNDPTKSTHGSTLITKANGRTGLNEWGLNYQTIEILQTFDDGGNETDLPMSSNPAIWETEPREDVGVDLYYEASKAYPVRLEQNIAEEYITVGDFVSGVGITMGTRVLTVNGNLVTFDSNQAAGIGLGTILKFRNYQHPDDYTLGDLYTNHATVKTTLTALNMVELVAEVHGEQRTLEYFNCYSFGNGVESNRMRDDYNAVTIDKGVKVSMPLATPYEEERRASGLIFSGIYNSTSGVNETNQFIQAEPITKDLNPVTGEILKIFARDTDLVTFCEDKVFKIQANKDALYNAGGNHQLTASNKVLGQAIPFRGEWGMSHRESFAADSYRLYFVDSNRKAVLRLSQDGMTPISNHGMKDYFFDNLKKYTKFVGSHDDRKGTYNLSMQLAWNLDPKTISFSEQDRGWSSFKSFIPEGGCSFNDNYYTFDNGQIWQHHDEAKAVSQTAAASTTNVLSMLAVPAGVRQGMNVVGDGINSGATVLGVSGNNVQISLTCSVLAGATITFSAPRNNFYNKQYDSSITMLFNQGPDIVKGFTTLKYEGSQARVTLDKPASADELTSGVSFESHDGSIPPSRVGQYYNNVVKNGWYVNSLKTDMQEGQAMEFKNKENKWFNYIHGAKRGVHSDGGVKSEGKFVDTREFSLQGIDFGSSTATTLDKPLTLLVNILDCCSEPLSVSNNKTHFNIHKLNNSSIVNGIITSQVDGDGVNAGSIISPKSFIANPDVGYFVAAHTFELCDGVRYSGDGGYGPNTWVPNASAFTGDTKVEYVKFSDTSTMWAVDNNILIEVVLKPGYVFGSSDEEILPEIKGEALQNPPTSLVTFETIIRGDGKEDDTSVACTSGIDLVFVLDYTGSMGAAMNNLKSGMSAISDAVIAECTNDDGDVAGYKLGVVLADEWGALCGNTVDGHGDSNPARKDIIYDGNQHNSFEWDGTYYNGYKAVNDEYSEYESYGAGNFQQYNNLPADQKYVGNGYKIALGGTVTCGGITGLSPVSHVVITAWSLMALNNRVATQSQIDKLNMGSPSQISSEHYSSGIPIGAGKHLAEPTDIAISKVINGFAGDWSVLGTSKRYVVLFTDALPSGEGDFNNDQFNHIDAEFLDELAADCVRESITCIIIGKGVTKPFTPSGGSQYFPWQKFATDTGGVWEDCANDGDWSAKVVSQLQTLCV